MDLSRKHAVGIFNISIINIPKNEKNSIQKQHPAKYATFNYLFVRV